MYEFFVEGQPQGKARARMGKGAHWYTPDQTAMYENLIKLRAKEAGVRYCPNQAFEIGLEAIYRRAKSRKEPWPPKPDPDNILKCVLDALQGIAYSNDVQVIRVTPLMRRYAVGDEQPGVRVSVTPLRARQPQGRRLRG
jgi:Holliday junction resolvase RusA-like endonuclease